MAEVIKLSCRYHCSRLFLRLLPVCFFAVLAAIVSCKGNKETPADRAAYAAKEYYDHLVAGRYADYLAGRAGTDSIPETYREQLLVNARQFMAQQTKEHGGISEIRVVRAEADSAGISANVFLLFCFSDSVKEEVVIPMVAIGDRWMMH